MNMDEVRELVARQAQAWMQQDIGLALEDFAVDAVFISPGGRWQGWDAIRRAAEGYFAVAAQVTVKIVRVLYDGRYGAVEWTWEETQRSTGLRHAADDAIIFELRDGKIVYWREYFDTAQLAHPLDAP
jgi:uncharacterized protein (TIGR02246 family)